MKISMVSPVYNERRSLDVLIAEVSDVFSAHCQDYELIFVDDGSNDGSREELRALSKQYNKVRVICLDKHLGKTAALRAGFAESRGEVIITMDSDMQDDPSDIPGLIQKLGEGYDLVCGWRVRRKGVRIRKVFSDIFNAVVSFIAGVRLHDINCGIKALKADVAKNIQLYSSLHRYIPVLAHVKGYKVCEVEVKNRLRRYDRSKYGIGRYFIAFMDMFRFSYIAIKDRF